MKRGLTVRGVEAAKPSTIRRELPDAYLPNLYLVVQPSGTKSWAVRYRSNGITRKHTLGSYPTLDLSTARRLGAKALRAAAEGRDPAREKAHVRVDSFEHVAEQYIERHCKRKNRARTLEETERLLRLHVLPRWRNRAIGDITRRDVRDLLDRIIEGGAPVAANRAFSAVRALFNWAMSADIVAASPCAGIERPTKETSCDRVLDDAELALIWCATDELGPPFGPLVKLLLLTGQRRNEVAGLEWKELDLQWWSLPRQRTKNNKAHLVPLSRQAIEVIETIPKISERFVFSTNGETRVSGFGKAKRRLDALLPQDMPPWRLNDLRRTVASGMARLGINLPVIEKVLNHASGSFAGIVGVYQKHEFSEEKRKALEAWGFHVAEIVSKSHP